MRYLPLLLLLVLAFLSCKDDDDAFDPNVNTVRIDGANFSSPEIPDGTYEFAVRLDAEDFADHLGKQITGVRYYAYQRPINAVLRIYAQNTDSEPGAVIYTDNIINEFTADSWNDHQLSQPIPVPNSDLWLAIEFSHNVTQMTVGCDNGPNVDGGDMMYRDSSWTNFQDFTNGEQSVNWNIRAIVD